MITSLDVFIVVIKVYCNDLCIDEKEIAFDEINYSIVPDIFMNFSTYIWRGEIFYYYEIYESLMDLHNNLINSHQVI